MLEMQRYIARAMILKLHSTVEKTGDVEVAGATMLVLHVYSRGYYRRRDSWYHNVDMKYYNGRYLKYRDSWGHNVNIITVKDTKDA
jgi:hypothetical protein